MKRLALGDRDTFECIGNACPFTCCAYWEVVIDKATDRYYQSVGGEYGKYLNENIDRSKDPAKMVMINGRCSQLRDDNLCRLYRELGPEHMCMTCKVFPRIGVNVGDYIMECLTLSCPEAGRLMFAHEEPLKITQAEIYNANIDQKKGKQAKEEMAFFRFSAKVFDTAMNILQSREFPVNVRQRLMLVMVRGVQDCIDAGDMKKAAIVLDVFQSPQNYKYLAEKPFAVTDPAEKYRFLQKLTPLLLRKQTANIDLMINTLFHGELTIDWKQSVDADEMETYVKQMTDELYSRDQEHFLIYSLFRYFWNNGDVKDRNLYRRAVFVVCLNQFRHLFEALIAYRCGRLLTHEERVMIISIFSRGVEHSNTLNKIKAFYELIDNENYGNLRRLYQIIG